MNAATDDENYTVDDMTDRHCDITGCPFKDEPARAFIEVEMTRAHGGGHLAVCSRHYEAIMVPLGQA